MLAILILSLTHTTRPARPRHSLRAAVEWLAPEAGAAAAAAVEARAQPWTASPRAAERAAAGQVLTSIGRLRACSAVLPLVLSASQACALAAV